jgi:hypothetical protein
LKCLTVLQPWASLLISGAKRYETRSWLTNHRGPLAIHAGQKLGETARRLCAQEPFRSALGLAGFRYWSDLPCGKVIGCVELASCFPAEDLTASRRIIEGSPEWMFGDYTPGRWAWYCLRAVRLAVPFACPGWRGLFDVPDELFSPLTQAEPEYALTTHHSPLTKPPLTTP